MQFPGDKAASQVFSGRVIFDHLGKTGGMAVTAWLRDVLGSGVVAPNVSEDHLALIRSCLLYTSPSPRDGLLSRMPSSA